MTHFKGKYRVESARLHGWDYSAAGWYFVTICTQHMHCFLGSIADGEMHLSPSGQIVAEEWQKTEHIRPNINLDAWIIMPNHLHSIIIIHNVVETPRRGVSTNAPSRLMPSSLGAIICQFKSMCTKRIRKAGFLAFAWQPRFYDHIIRNEKSLQRIREYIINNPLKWELDRYNPANLKT